MGCSIIFRCLSSHPLASGIAKGPARAFLQVPINTPQTLDDVLHARPTRSVRSARAAARWHTARSLLPPSTGMILVLLAVALAPQLRVSRRHVSSTVKMTDTVTTAMDDCDSLNLAQLRARLLPAWHALRALAEERSLTTRLDCSVGEWASRTLLATRLVRRCPAEGRPRPATHTRPCRGQERLPLDRCHVAESTIAAAG